MATRDPYLDHLIAQQERPGTRLTPLEVRLVQPPSRKPPPLAQRIQTLWRDRPLFALLLFAFVIFLLALGVMAMSLWARDIRSLVVSEVQSGYNELDFAVKYSSWLVPKDEESFTLTLVNNSNRSLRVTACLVFSGTVPVETGLKDSNVANFGTLAPNQRKTRTVELLLEKPTGGVAQAELWVSAKEWSQEEKLGSYTFDIAPVPYLKSGIRRFLGAAVAGALPLLVGLLRGALKEVVPEMRPESGASQ